jgi:tRNA A58 N-methylase Trm61
MVAYQPTPARRLFDWIGRGTLTERDVVMDLGSGLGHVTLLTAICTRAQCVGIEVNEGYVDCARRSAEALNLSNAAFIRQDVRVADLSLGTVFYLYTPFVGGMLRAVLDLLRREAERREIRVCTYGPCTPVVAEERWLEAAGGFDADRIVEFRSRRSSGMDGA